MFPEEYFDFFVSFFKGHYAKEMRKNTCKPCRIKVCGEFVELPNSRKTLWKSKRDAKLALNNAFSCEKRPEVLSAFARHWDAPTFQGELRAAAKTSCDNEAWKMFLTELEKRGILEFVELDEVEIYR